MRRKQRDDGTRIDLLIGYTRQVSLAAGSDETRIVARVANAVCFFNEALRRSRVPTKICVLDFMALSQFEEGTASDPELLSRVQGVAALRRERRRLRADAVSVLVARRRSNDWGEAEIRKAEDDDFAERAYSITSWLYLDGGFALAHEVAHNFGCQHNLDPCRPRSPWSHGHFFVWRKKTVVWGDDRPKLVDQPSCTILGKPPANGSCKPVPVFSSPLVSEPEQGEGAQPTGVAERRDNARAIREGLRTFANWGNGLRRVP